MMLEVIQPGMGRENGVIKGAREREKGWADRRGESKSGRRERVALCEREMERRKESHKDEKRRRNGENGEKKEMGNGSGEKISKMTKVAKRRSRGESTPFQALLRNPFFSPH